MAVDLVEDEEDLKKMTVAQLKLQAAKYRDLDEESKSASRYLRKEEYQNTLTAVIRRLHAQPAGDSTSSLL